MSELSFWGNRLKEHATREYRPGNPLLHNIFVDLSTSELRRKTMPDTYENHLQDRVTTTSEALTEAAKRINEAEQHLKRARNSHAKQLEAVDRDLEQRKQRLLTVFADEEETLVARLQERKNLYAHLSRELRQYTEEMALQAGFALTEKVSVNTSETPGKASETPVEEAYKKYAGRENLSPNS